MYKFYIHYSTIKPTWYRILFAQIVSFTKCLILNIVLAVSKAVRIPSIFMLITSRVAFLYAVPKPLMSGGLSSKFSSDLQNNSSTKDHSVSWSLVTNPHRQFQGVWVLLREAGDWLIQWWCFATSTKWSKLLRSMFLAIWRKADATECKPVKNCPGKKTTLRVSSQKN